MRTKKQSFYLYMVLILMLLGLMVSCKETGYRSLNTSNIDYIKPLNDTTVAIGYHIFVLNGKITTTQYYTEYGKRLTIHGNELRIYK